MKTLEKQEQFGRSKKSLDVCQKCELQIKQLSLEVERLKQKKVTQTIRDSITKLTKEIEVNQKIISDYSALEKLSPDTWVRNGKPVPGVILELAETNSNYPQVWVQFEGGLKELQRPSDLTPIKSSELNYSWVAGELIRSFDSKPCDDFKFLLEEHQSCSRCLKSAKNAGDWNEANRIKLRQDWINSHWSILVRDRFRINDGFIYQGKPVVITGYEMYNVTVEGCQKSSLLYPLIKSDDTNNPRFGDPCQLEAIPLGQQIKLFKEQKTVDEPLDPSDYPLTANIPIELIKRDRDTQQRVSLNHETVVEYAEAMKNGDKFPEVKLILDEDGNYWLTDGFHTTEAAWSIGATEVEAIISLGTKRDAILASVEANTSHGLRRTNADKRRAVTTLLEDEEWSKWSNREIARRCKVSESLVRSLRNDEKISLRLNAVTKCTNQKPTEENISETEKEISPRLNEVTKCTNEEKVTVNVDSEIAKDEDDFTKRVYKNKHGQIVEMETKSIGKSCNKAQSSMALFQENSDLSNKEQINYQVGDVVTINPSSDRADERLIGYKSSMAIITKVNEFSLDLKLWGKEFKGVSISDIKPIPPEGIETFDLFLPTMNRSKLIHLMNKFDSPKEIEKYLLISTGYEGAII